MRGWFTRRDVPAREQIIHALLKLKPIPEADRMRLKRPAPPRIEDWRQRSPKRTA
jgi:hypothetical protein